VTAFYKDLSHWISTTTATRPDGTPVRFDNNGAGRVYGMEVVARHELTSKFTGWLAYTLSRATRRDSGSTTYRLFEYDQTHILTVFGTYELPRNWRIGSRFRLVSGDPPRRSRERSTMLRLLATMRFSARNTPTACHLSCNSICGWTSAGFSTVGC